MALAPKLLVSCLDALEGWVLAMASSPKLNEKLRALGFEVFAPDMSMFTPDSGVHCLSQALRRDPD